MQGTWKEKTFGYIKDCKRKKQKRKHLIKEKNKPILKKYYYKDISNEIVRPGVEVILNEDVKFKHSGFVDVYKAEVFKFVKSINAKHITDICHFKNAYYEMPGYVYTFSSSLKDVYRIPEEKSEGYYDAETNEKLTAYDSITIMDFLYKKEIQFKNPIKLSGRKRFATGITTQVFLYGKPLPESFHKLYGFYSCSGRRGFSQKKANKRDRRLLKEWLGNRNFDTDIKTHETSISIAWEVF